MSNKPRIHAFCKAGCAWETVHRSEFESIAGHINVELGEDGTCYLQPQNEYKIFCNKGSDNQFIDSLTFVYLTDGKPTAHYIRFENVDEYATSYMFRFLDAKVNSSASTITIVYEIAGYRYSETISGTNLSLKTENYIHLVYATKVLLNNSDQDFIVVPEDVGDIETALDSILAVENELIGGEA